MRRSKPLLSLLSLAATVLLTGCAVTPAAFERADSAHTLTVWTYLAGDEEEVNFAKLDELFTRSHPDVRIRRVAIPLGEFTPKLLAAAATGDGPDIVIGNPVVDFPLLSKAHVYADLTERWQRWPEHSKFSDIGLWRDDKGRLDAIHWRFNDLGLWYNKDILEAEHIPVPRTLPEFEAALRTVAQNGKQRPLTVAGDPSVQAAWSSMMWLYTQHVNYCTLNSPRTTDVLAMLAGWLRKGYLPIDTSSLPIETAFDRFLSGNYAFTIGGSWELGKLRSEPPTFRYGSAMIPSGKAGNKMAFAGESVGIGAYAKNKDLAWSYLTTSYLSKRAQLVTFRQTGALPPRLDIRRGPRVSGDPVARPFVAALEPSVLQPWPDNPNTLEAQTDVGAAFSTLFSGDVSGAEIAEQIRSDVTRALKDGGGGC
ncbi:ABC transporter substrate-binding protein [Sciscionella marina]|uniref:ABC transporter substrate-binding protein n=1 Tax=Sciscionella marina TaxID=508770 RepID=UPI0012F6FA61|nr:extracellular solute-binding protein [Sciscionella marina]